VSTCQLTATYTAIQSDFIHNNTQLFVHWKCECKKSASVLARGTKENVNGARSVKTVLRLHELTSLVHKYSWIKSEFPLNAILSQRVSPRFKLTLSYKVQQNNASSSVTRASSGYKRHLKQNNKYNSKRGYRSCVDGKLRKKCKCNNRVNYILELSLR